MNQHAKQAHTIGILVGGGPAPGINGVIAAATIEAINEGMNVIGILDGYMWLAQGDTDHVVPLAIENVSRIHFHGGSILRPSREYPLGDPHKLANVIAALHRLGIDCLLTIGGDNTGFVASQIEQQTAGAIRVAHVLKAIDNDLPLHGAMPAFGYETARSSGTEIVLKLMEQARHASCWHVVVSIGQRAGHLALGIGKAAGATLVIIPEQFKQPQISLADLCDVIEGTIIKRRAMGHHDGVVVMPECLAKKLMLTDRKQLKERNLALPEYDEFGNLRPVAVNLGRAVRDEIVARFAARRIALTVVEKEIGYEVWSAPPVPFDCEYTRDLGYSAVRFLAGGGSGAVIAIQGGRMTPRPIADVIDKHGRSWVRFVDTTTESYEVARKYMIRLEPGDFRSEAWVAKLAAAGGYGTPAEFRRKFARLASRR